MELTVEGWTVSDLSLTPEKVAAVWKVIKRHQALFSDLTRNDPNNFVRALTAPHTLWFAVRNNGVLVGIIWFGDLHLVTEMTAHMVFFDRRTHEKLPVCREVIKQIFRDYPVHRINVTPPDNYVATIKLLRRLGMSQEGIKRESVLLYGKWRNQLLFGITRQEAEAL